MEEILNVLFGGLAIFGAITLIVLLLVWVDSTLPKDK